MTHNFKLKYIIKFDPNYRLRYRIYNEEGEPDYILISTPSLELNVNDKLYTPFPNDNSLSFAQRDKYINELGYFLKKNYNDRFKSVWCCFQEQANANNNIDWNDEWENLNYDCSGFNLDVHEFALKVMSKIFPKFVEAYNKQQTEEEIKGLISCAIVFDIIKDDIKSKPLDEVLGTFKKKIEELLLFVDNKYNILILTCLLDKSQSIEF